MGRIVKGMFSTRRLLLLCSLSIVLIGTMLVAGNGKDSPKGKGDFELGVQPPAPGMGDVVNDLAQRGPDWSDLFAADGTLRDDFDDLDDLDQ